MEATTIIPFGQMGSCRSTVRTPNFKPTEQALPATKQALPAIPPSLRATSLYTREAIFIYPHAVSSMLHAIFPAVIGYSILISFLSQPAFSIAGVI